MTTAGDQSGRPNPVLDLLGSMGNSFQAIVHDATEHTTAMLNATAEVPAKLIIAAVEAQRREAGHAILEEAAARKHSTAKAVKAAASAHQQGMEASLQHQTRLAAQLFRRATHLQPSCASYAVSHADALLQLGDIAAAVSEYQRAEQLDATHPSEELGATLHQKCVAAERALAASKVSRSEATWQAMKRRALIATGAVVEEDLLWYDQQTELPAKAKAAMAAEVRRAGEELKAHAAREAKAFAMDAAAAEREAQARERNEYLAAVRMEVARRKAEAADEARREGAQRTDGAPASAVTGPAAWAGRFRSGHPRGRYVRAAWTCGVALAVATLAVAVAVLASTLTGTMNTIGDVKVLSFG